MQPTAGDLDTCFAKLSHHLCGMVRCGDTGELEGKNGGMARREKEILPSQLAFAYTESNDSYWCMAVE